MLFSCSDKRQEIGVLRALGSNKVGVSSIFVVSNLLFAIICIVLSIIIAYFLTPLFNMLIVNEALMAQAVTFSYRQGFLISGLVLLASLLGSIIPVVRLTKMKSIDIISERKM